MRSHLFSVRMPHPLHDGAVRRQLEVPYEDLGDYMNGLALCDQIIRRSHEFTRWFHQQSRRVQDFIYDCLASWIASAPGSQPTLSAHFCFGIIKVMMRRHACPADRAIKYLPVELKQFCAQHGFA